MKKVKKVIAISTICIIGMCTQSFSATKGFIKSETVRLRQKATTDSPIVALMSLNEEVQILAEENGWYKIKYKNSTGYANKSYISAKTSSNDKTKENDNTLVDNKIQENNNTSLENKTQENNTTINNQTQTNSNVSTENNTSINIENIDNTQKTEENQVNISENNIEKDIIKEKLKGEITTEIKLKLLPTINSSDILTLQQGRELIVKEIINDWCYIEATTGSGWIRKQILGENIKVVEQIKDEDANKQETEETQNEQKQDEEKNNQIIEETKKEEENANNKNKEEDKQKETVSKKIGYVNVNTVNLRSKTDTSSKILTSLSKNTQVTILGEEDNWYKVKVNNITGYIATKYLSNQKVAEKTSRSLENDRTPIESTNNSNKQESKTTNNEEKSNTTKESKEAATNTSASKTTNTSSGAEIVAYAKKYLGSKYVIGGMSPSSGFDCSGFTSYVYKNFGKTIARTSKGQSSNGRAVSKSELQLGDLVIFNNSSNSSVGHVGIYAGGNTFIHAANSKRGVITTSLSDSYYSKRYVGARRII